MLNGLRAGFLKDWKWKIFAFGFAVALWFYCMNVTGGTIKTDTIYLPLTIENLDSLATENLVLENETELASRYILLQIRGKREDVERLKDDTTKISAYIDLGLIEFTNSKMLGERQETGVYVEKSIEFSGVEVLNKTPPSVGITLDRYDKETHEVKIAVSGRPADNYSSSTMSANPTTVEIWGARSTLAKIEQVRVDIDVNGKTEDVNLTIEPVAYDIDGNVVSDIEITPPTADVSVAIDKLGRLQILQPSYIGEPPAGYVITDVDWEPKYAEVVGSEDAINNMKPISLTPEDVSGFTVNKAVPYDLWAYLPEGLQILNGTSQEVVVTFHVERLVEKTVEIPVSALNVRGYTSDAEFTEETIPVTIQAIQSDIDAVQATELIGTVDLTGLEEGVHTVPVTFALPDGVTIVEPAPTAEITITDEEPAATENTENPPADIGGETDATPSGE